MSSFPRQLRDEAFMGGARLCMDMRIGVLGWGSLLWDVETPTQPVTVGPWHKWGPSLPIEFARVSSSRKGALTLVVLPEPSPPPAGLQRTVWALSPESTLREARLLLSQREGCSIEKIPALTTSGAEVSGPPHSAVKLVGEWLADQRSLDAVIWTGLSSNWDEPGKPGERYGPFSAEAAMRYLIGDERLCADGRRLAEEYIRHAPPWIDTAVRRRAEEWGWTQLPLPPSCLILEP